VGPMAIMDVLENRKILTTSGIRTTDRPARSLVTKPNTELLSFCSLITGFKISGYLFRNFVE
jgi:hypothetical protein